MTGRGYLCPARGRWLLFCPHHRWQILLYGIMLAGVAFLVMTVLDKRSNSSTGNSSTGNAAPVVSSQKSRLDQFKASKSTVPVSPTNQAQGLSSEPSAEPLSDRPALKIPLRL